MITPLQFALEVQKALESPWNRYLWQNNHTSVASLGELPRFAREKLRIIDKLTIETYLNGDWDTLENVPDA